MKSTLANILVLGTLAVALTGCSTTSGDKSTPIESASPSASANPVNEKAAAATEPVGTRANAYLANTKALLGPTSVWTVGFQTTNLDASVPIMAENEFNEVVAGRSFVMVPVNIDVQENGGQTMPDGAEIWGSLSFEFVSAAGVAYGQGSDDYCGVIPNALSDMGTVYSGASIVANVCAQVPSDQIAGGLWSVSNSVGEKLFFTLS